MTTPTTTALRMVRGEVDLREFNRWMGSRRLQDPDHAMHCLLKECFGDFYTNDNPAGIAPQPFRMVATRGASVGCLYGYTRVDADELREMAGVCACPLQEQVMPPSSLASKPMPTEWRVGLRLGFEVRVRPIVRLRKDLSRVPPDKLRLFRTRPGEADAPRPGKECDVFQWEALDSSATLGMTRTREEVYVDWLDKQFERRGGAVLDKCETKLVSFQRTRAVRKLHRRYSEGPDALMHGELEITDGAKFSKLLTDGIGRHRAYGYGMLLLRPPGRRG